MILSPMTRRALLLTVLLTLPACTDRDAPRPVPVPGPTPDGDTLRPLSSREPIPPAATAPATAADPDDPAEPGISDLARLARYVFRTMRRHQEVCPFENPFRERLHFTLQVEASGGRMTRVGVGGAGLEPEGAREARPLAKAGWPRELTAYMACLAPHLEAVAMDPAPADGVYDADYSFEGNPTGKSGP
jgi:hypothetical protein